MEELLQVLNSTVTKCIELEKSLKTKLEDAKKISEQQSKLAESLSAKEKELDAREKEIAGVESLVALSKKIEADQATLNAGLLELSVQRNGFSSYVETCKKEIADAKFANSEKASSLSAKESELNDKEKKLNEEKETYKENLIKEIAKNIGK